MSKRIDITNDEHHLEAVVYTSHIIKQCLIRGDANIIRFEERLNGDKENNKEGSETVSLH